MKKKTLLWIIFVLLCLPLILTVLGLKMNSFNGYIEKQEKPIVSKRDLASGEYQNNVEKYLKQNFAFSSYFIRIADQILYSFFSETKADVVVGKKNYLYQLGYICNTTGENFKGSKIIADNVSCLAKLRDSLSKSNTELVVLIAPGKAAFYPEYIPNRYLTQKTNTTNYSLYSRLLYQKQINYLDFNRWICSLKGKTSYPLYPKTGVHWSQYACLLAQDSLVRYLEVHYQRLLPHIVAQKIVMSNVMNGKDDDAEQILNLLFPISDNPMPHITFAVDRKTEGRKKD